MYTSKGSRVDLELVLEELKLLEPSEQAQGTEH
jgi:hypothetical protein